jgi:hypothetical protein
MLSVLASQGELAGVTTIEEALGRYRRTLEDEYPPERFAALVAGYVSRFARSA